MVLEKLVKPKTILVEKDGNLIEIPFQDFKLKVINNSLCYVTFEGWFFPILRVKTTLKNILERIEK